MILLLYRLLAPLLALLLPLAARFSPKLAATLAWRREQPFDSRVTAALAGKTPRYWIHAASAGELEQALPLLQGLRDESPEAALMLTIGSVSAREAVAKTNVADLVLPLPVDLPRRMGALLDGFAPDAVAAVKWDIWPNLLLCAKKRGVPVLLLGAVLAGDSRRARFPGYLLARPVHRGLSAIGTASAGDAERFVRLLGVRADRVSVTGDSRFDRVVERRTERRPLPIESTAEIPRCLVAGSSWPAEEAMLLPAYAELSAKHVGLRLLLVPHEPSEARLADIEGSAKALDLPIWRFSARPELGAGICVVDQLGILPELYRLGHVALVGGGFGRGLHSVLEAAAHGLPVLMGPNCGRAEEALRLVDAGGAFIFRDRNELVELLTGFLGDREALRAAGMRAAAFVETQCGAAKRNLELLRRTATQEGNRNEP